MKYIILPLLLISAITQAKMSASEISSSSKMSFCIGTNGVNHNESSFQADDRITLTASDSVSIDTSNCSAANQEIVKIPYLRNYPLNTEYPEITAAIIAIHSDGGDPDDIYDTLNKVVNINNKKLVIAPVFLESSDDNNYHSEEVASMVYWDMDEEHTNWRIGGRSIAPANVQISNFQIVDAIIKKIVDKLPNLQTLSIVGFSAGGQAVQRYSLFNQIDGILNTSGDKITFRYVVASPATYTYFTEKRYNYSNKAILEEISLADKLDCSDNYNGYRYGLENLDAYPYVANVGVDSEDFKNNTRNRNRLFVAGENDNSTTTNCRRNLMGVDAPEKGFNYFYHLQVEGVASNATYCSVANKSHQVSVLEDSSVLRFIRKGYLICSN
jgi:hypothetical protein